MSNRRLRIEDMVDRLKDLKPDFWMKTGKTFNPPAIMPISISTILRDGFGQSRWPIGARMEETVVDQGDTNAKIP